MKIAYLNPWSGVAENQAYSSLAAAARNIGVELVDCRVPEDVARCQPEFVIAVAPQLPKSVDFPCYLTMHVPKRLTLENSMWFGNLLTYDGYLTISDSLERFTRDFCFGVGRPEIVGFYYNTPQVSRFVADMAATVRDGKLKLVYFGTNWDRRAPHLLRILDNRGILKIHGPEARWKDENYRGFAGPLPFDGEAPQRTYAENGLGLVLLPEEYMRDDVISNRIFEISSAGAVSVCPNIPWIRKWFGDSVFYFEPFARPGDAGRQIIGHYESCQRDPEMAQAMGRHAREVFEKYFAAEKLIGNAIAYHKENRRRHAESLATLRASGTPEISVIVRCGGRPAEMLNVAIDSIRRQTYGRFTVILSKYKDLDLSAITADRSGAIAEFTEVLTPDGGRSATLRAGLAAVRTEYFAMLDDDDFWLSDHAESLFAAARVTDPDFDVVFSGIICKTSEPVQLDWNFFWDSNLWSFGFRESPQCIEDIGAALSPNSWIARSELLAGGAMDLPDMESAEDSLLAAFVSRRKRPVFSYKATAFVTRGHGVQSDWSKLPSRRDDLLSLALRTGFLWNAGWLNQGSIAGPMRAWRDLPPHQNANLWLTQTWLSQLGEAKLGDNYEEGWELLARMNVGEAGVKSDGGTIATRRQQSGFVCFGPYVPLPEGRYRVDFVLERQAGMGQLMARRRAGGPVGSLDVVSVAADWQGAARSFTATETTVAVEFAISPELQGKPVEFRLTSNGLTNFEVQSVLLWYLGHL